MPSSASRFVIWVTRVAFAVQYAHAKSSGNTHPDRVRDDDLRVAPVLVHVRDGRLDLLDAGVVLREPVLERVRAPLLLGREHLSCAA